MVLTKTLFYTVAGALALSTNAAPLQKRIAQVIADSTKQWVAACTAAGGADKCGTTSQTAFMALLAGAGDCDQQNAADAMIDLSKSLNNDPKMIALAQVFAQQPRNSPEKLSVNYCQQEPKNAELKGLFQCQFQGVDPQTFTKNVKVGGKGTIPLGLNAPLDPPGSCKANPQGGIADGSQLVDVTQDPGVGNASGAGSSNSTGTANVGSASDSGDASVNGNATEGSGASGASASSDDASGEDSGANSGSGSGQCADGAAAAGSKADGDASSSESNESGSDAGTGGSDGSAASEPSEGTTNAAAGSDDGSSSTGDADASATESGAGAAATSGGNGGAGGDFKLQNGKDAQAQNAKFAALTDSSTCSEGDQACVDNGFAQCVGGKFQTTPCAGGTKCFALPLVNSPGTSIACTTEADAASRMEATGATGGVTGK